MLFTMRSEVRVMKTKEANRELEFKINKLRQKMIDTAKIRGFNHPDTIKCSQELDNILYKYQVSKR